MDIIYLDRNENQYGPAPACFKALRDPDFKLLSEYSRDFSRGVKSCLSARLAAEFNVSEKNIVLGFGGEDILKQAVHCYIHKGDKIMIPSFSWWYYKKIADEVSGIKVEYPIVEGTDSFHYDIGSMLKIYREHKPKLVLISSPNNPTGNRLEPEELKTVLKEMREAVVVLDEAYTLFYDKSASRLKEIVEEFPNVLIIRTFSKYYALAGLRIGFALMGRNHEQFSLFSARYLGYNRLSEKIALAALDSEEYYGGMCKKMNADMDMYFTEFNKLPGFKAYRSFANFILVKIPPAIKEPLNKYLTGRGMIVKFMAEDGLFTHIRITLGTREQNSALMNMIKKFLQENPAK